MRSTKNVVLVYVVQWQVDGISDVGLEFAK